MAWRFLGNLLELFRILVIPGRATWREPGIHNHDVAMSYFVYMMASSKHGTLDLGVTNDLIRRGHQHRAKTTCCFTARYQVTKLVWFETCDDPTGAMTREKELKKWRRDWKIRLIEEDNPNWMDLLPALSG